MPTSTTQPDPTDAAYLHAGCVCTLQANGIQANETGGAHMARRYAFVNEEMAMTAREVLSYKFIPVIYQLVARIGSKHKEGAAFQSTLHALVARIATDHPYHAMYQVSAQASRWFRRG
jgi:hypothetical protein